MPNIIKPGWWPINRSEIAENFRDLWDGLIFLSPNWEGSGGSPGVPAARDVVGGQLGVPAYLVSWDGTPYGSGVKCASASGGDMYFADNLAGYLGDEITFGSFFRVDTAESSQFSFCAAQRTGSNYNWGLYTNSAKRSYAFVYTSSGVSAGGSGSAQAAGSYYANVATYDGSTLTIYEDGVSVGTNTTSGNIADNGGTLNLGGYNSACSRHTHLIAFVAARAWDVRQVQKWSANPFGLIERRRGKSIVFVAGAPPAGNAMPMAMNHYRRRRTG